MFMFLGVFVIGCGQPYNSTTHMQAAENTAEVEAVVYEIDLPTTDHIEEHDSGYIGSVEVVQTVGSEKILVDENFYVTYIPYPLIFAVLDYFEGALEVPNSRILPWSSRSYAAYITDIDGDGALGILALRFEDFSRDEQFIHHRRSFRIFYLYNGDVIYKDFRDPDYFIFSDGSPFALSISTDKRLFMGSFGVDGFRTYTFFTIESGKIMFDFTIIQDPLSWEYGYVTYSAFYKLEGGPIWYERFGYWHIQFRERISEEEFNKKTPVTSYHLQQLDITEQIFQSVW